MHRVDQSGPLRPKHIDPALGRWAVSGLKVAFPGLWLEEAVYTLRSLEGSLDASEPHHTAVRRAAAVAGTDRVAVAMDTVQFDPVMTMVLAPHNMSPTQ